MVTIWITLGLCALPIIAGVKVGNKISGWLWALMVLVCGFVGLFLVGEGGDVGAAIWPSVIGTVVVISFSK